MPRGSFGKIKEYGVEHIIATEKDKNWPTLAEYIELRK